MKKALTIVSVIILFITLLGGISFAWPDWCKGMPNFTAGKATGYFIWHEDGWNVKATTMGKAHVFDGTITCDNKFTITHSDQLKEGQGDFVKLSAPGQLVFRMTLSGDVKGFGFKTNGTSVTFNLRKDGAPCPTSSIFVGSGTRHPKANPFHMGNKKKAQ
jgi:hypothetical protein